MALKAEIGDFEVGRKSGVELWRRLVFNYEKKTAYVEDPHTDFPFRFTISQPILPHNLHTVPQGIILLFIKALMISANSLNHMGELEGEPVGLSLGMQAGGFLGLYLGFSLSVVSVLTDPSELQRLVSLLCLPPVFMSIILGPFLARRRRPVALADEPVKVAREALQIHNEGQGKWRALSHINSDGRTIRIDMHNLTNIENVLKDALIIAEDYPIRFIVGQGKSSSNQQNLRNVVLSYIEENVNITRRNRSAKSIEVIPQPSVDHINYQRKTNKILIILLPIISFFAWLEMR